MTHGPVLAIAVAAVGVVGACALARGNDDATSTDVVAADDSGADAAPEAAPTPRRLCPSAQIPDGGGWVSVDGIDVSDWQFTDWDEVHANNPNIKFAIVRISAGLIRNDTRFVYDWPGLKRNGIVRGVYQYFQPRFSAIAQAELYLQRLQDEGGLDATDLPPVLDFENTNGMPDATVSCRVKLWLTKVEQATKRLPIIYSSNNFKQFLPPEFSRYPLWVPNYVKNPLVTCPITPDTWPMWTMWQYTSDGTVQGVYVNGPRSGPEGGAIALDTSDGGDGGPLYSRTDLDWFNGTFDEFKTFVASTASDGTIPDPPPLANPPHVGGDADCRDGCCIADPLVDDAAAADQ